MLKLGERSPLLDRYEWLDRSPLEGYAVVRRWGAIRRATAWRLPHRVMEYAGLHRAPIEPCSDLQQLRAGLGAIRLFEIRAEQLGSPALVSSEGWFPWIADESDALDVMSWANAEERGTHEVIWARLETPRSAATPPVGATCLGFDLSQMTYAYWSVIASAVLGFRVHDDGALEPCGESPPLRSWGARLTPYGLLSSIEDGESLFGAMQSMGGGEPDDSYALRSIWRPLVDK